jgi:hypothetical protein
MKITVEVSDNSHRHMTLVDLLRRDNYIFSYEAENQALQQHNVSGKQPDTETIIAAAIKYALNQWNAKGFGVEQNSSRIDFIAGAEWALSQVACANGGEAQGVSVGERCHCEQPIFEEREHLGIAMVCRHCGLEER